MLSIVPHPNRVKAATLAAVVVAMCVACGSSTTESAGPIAPVSVDCGLQVPGPGAVDGALADIEGFTITPICPSEAFPVAASQAFDSVAAGLVSQNGNQILRVLAGQLKSGDGDAFVRQYISNLAEQTPEGVGVPSETQQLGEHVVTHFNIPLTAEGYAFGEGSSVLIAYVASGSPPATVEDALTKILANIR
jgi:hypothetical protein